MSLQRWGVDLSVISGRPERAVEAVERWMSLGSHPYVRTCHYVEVVDGKSRIFVEHVEGGSLREWIDDRGDPGLGMMESFSSGMRRRWF